MRSWIHSAIALVASLLFVCGACDSGKKPTPSAGSAKPRAKPAVEEPAEIASQPAETPVSEKTDKPSESEPAPASVTEKPKPALPDETAVAVAKKPASPVAAPAPSLPPATSMPQVLLTDTETKTCLVKVGDPMPELKLPDLEGKNQSLADLLGERLTVVQFWTSAQPYAVEELGDLSADVAAKYVSQGVKVVAINESDPAATAKKVVEQVGAAALTHLHDSDGAALAKVATKKLPRTYLLDARGKILWLDLEYSRSTRRDLSQAIRFTLAK